MLNNILIRYLRLLGAGPPALLLAVFPTRKYFDSAHAGTMACSSGDVPADEINDPGAAPYGNFINYYSFNPPENRLSLIPASLLQDLGYRDEHQPTLILDVGCNSGVRTEKALASVNMNNLDCIKLMMTLISSLYEKFRT